MADREMLESAAKAAGMYVLAEGVTWPDEKVGWFFNQVGSNPPALYDRSTLTRTIWAPLTDDGDALRLAVKLELLPDLWWDDALVSVEYRIHGQLAGQVTEPRGKDVYAATRRAIVRAAAEIGRQMA